MASFLDYDNNTNNDMMKSLSLSSKEYQVVTPSVMGRTNAAADAASGMEANNTRFVLQEQEQLQARDDLEKDAIVNTHDMESMITTPNKASIPPASPKAAMVTPSCSTSVSSCKQKITFGIATLGENRSSTEETMTKKIQEQELPPATYKTVLASRHTLVEWMRRHQRCLIPVSDWEQMKHHHRTRKSTASVTVDQLVGDTTTLSGFQLVSQSSSSMAGEMGGAGRYIHLNWQVYQEQQAAALILKQLLFDADKTNKCPRPTTTVVGVRTAYHYVPFALPASYYWKKKNKQNKNDPQDDAVLQDVIPPHRIVAAKPSCLMWKESAKTYALVAVDQARSPTALDIPMPRSATDLAAAGTMSTASSILGTDKSSRTSTMKGMNDFSVKMNQSDDLDWQQICLILSLAQERKTRLRIKTNRAQEMQQKIDTYCRSHCQTHQMSVVVLTEDTFQSLGFCGSPKRIAAIHGLSSTSGQNDLTFVKGTAPWEYRNWKLVFKYNNNDKNDRRSSKKEVFWTDSSLDGGEDSLCHPKSDY